MDRRDSGRKGERFTDPIVGLAWHADGTPYRDEDYRRAGLYVPTAEQLAAWEKADAERARAGRRNDTGENYPSE